MPEYLIGIIISVGLGWGGFTWKRAEDALLAARQASDQVDRVELKMAEEYLTKKDFELYMDRLFDTLAEMKAAVKYVSDRVDYHVVEQANETRGLRQEVDRLRKDPHNNY